MKKHLPVKQFNEIKKAFIESKSKDLTKTIDHNSVHAWLEIKTPVTQWIRKSIKKFGFIEGVDFIRTESKKSTISRDLQNGFLDNINNLQTKVVTFHCSVDMVKQLAMVASSEKGKLARLYFLDCETKAHEKQQQLEDRQTLKVEFKPMTDAISDAHEDPKHYHFSNEADMINRIVLGMSASKFKAHHEIGKNDSVRDYMTELQMKAVIDLQRANTVFIQLGDSFEDRKKKLNSMFDLRFKDKLIEEVKMIEG